MCPFFQQPTHFHLLSGKIAVYLVKYWTLLLEIFAVVAWVYFCGTGHLDEGATCDIDRGEACW